MVAERRPFGHKNMTDMVAGRDLYWPYQLDTFWTSEKYGSAFTPDRTGLQKIIWVPFHDDVEVETEGQDF
ncbi:hypothetical protein F511_11096 [Dorcoceras hygrometricum]|uniref:Uncharacterized protein n=1 Tax=Dorcoceras hygrometricum TaxID=472368 RepID=A0A2Z7BPP0_9LAMI|nr:hypothetical protein F511_11096 [Dorcoceras hygrometricum]